jgi:MFS family permease
LVISAAACTSFITYSYMFWTAPLLLRSHGATTTEVGFALMLASAGGGSIGVGLGGFLSDRWRRRSASGRVYVALLSVALMLPTGLGLLVAPTAKTAYVMAFVYQAVSTMWVSSATALVTELVLPRMRAIATALFLMLCTFGGLALGPFAVGRVSDAFKAGGSSSDDSLRIALGLALLLLIPGAGLFAAALRTVPDDEASLWERARAAGES